MSSAMEYNKLKEAALQLPEDERHLVEVYSNMLRAFVTTGQSAAIIALAMVGLEVIMLDDGERQGVA